MEPSPQPVKLGLKEGALSKENVGELGVGWGQVWHQESLSAGSTGIGNCLETRGPTVVCYGGCEQMPTVG